MFPIKPYNDKLIVKRVTEKEKIGSIFIPTTAKERPNIGKIVSVGVDVKYAKLDTLVLFGKYAGTEIEVNEEEYTMLREEELIGVFVDEDTISRYQVD